MLNVQYSRERETDYFKTNLKFVKTLFSFSLLWTYCGETAICSRFGFIIIPESISALANYDPARLVAFVKILRLWLKKTSVAWDNLSPYARGWLLDGGPLWKSLFKVLWKSPWRAPVIRRIRRNTKEAKEKNPVWLCPGSAPLQPGCLQTAGEHLA